MGKGNPYKLNNGRFGSSSHYDYVLYEPNKEKEIEGNEIQTLNHKDIKESEYVYGQAKVVSKQEFDIISKDATVFYRGQETSQHVLEDSSAPIGSHAWGRGLYFTNRRETADDTYSNGRQLIQACVKPNAKVILIQDAHKQFKNQFGRNPHTNIEVSQFLAKNKICDALLIKKASTGHEDYLLVMNRSALIVNYIRR